MLNLCFSNRKDVQENIPEHIVNLENDFEVIRCDDYAQKSIECQYRAIIHPEYHHQCAVLNVMTELCHNTQHLIMKHQADEVKNYVFSFGSICVPIFDRYLPLIVTIFVMYIQKYLK